MAKGWIHFATINDTFSPDKRTVIRNEQGLNNLIRNTTALSTKELKEESNTLYDKKNMEEEQLLDAFANKQLKSKMLIKQALKIKKTREGDKDK